jgi:outer membrane murein-binding lipoprotein Lpp
MKSLLTVIASCLLLSGCVDMEPLRQAQAQIQTCKAIWNSADYDAIRPKFEMKVLTAPGQYATDEEKVELEKYIASSNSTCGGITEEEFAPIHALYSRQIDWATFQDRLSHAYSVINARSAARAAQFNQQFAEQQREQQAHFIQNLQQQFAPPPLPPPPTTTTTQCSDDGTGGVICTSRN